MYKKHIEQVSPGSQLDPLPQFGPDLTYSDVWWIIGPEVGQIPPCDTAAKVVFPDGRQLQVRIASRNRPQCAIWPVHRHPNRRRSLLGRLLSCFRTDLIDPARLVGATLVVP